MWACRNCWTRLPRYATSCPQCGAVVDPYAPDPFRNRLVVAMVIILAIGGGIGYWRRHNGVPPRAAHASSTGGQSGLSGAGLATVQR